MEMHSRYRPLYRRQTTVRQQTKRYRIRLIL
jgi:hypothetical protein